jgi:hypothetical protein
MEPVKKENNGVITTTGGLLKPHNPEEDKYRRVLAAPPPSAANLNEPVSLVTPSFDPRPDIFGQGRMGSCASCSTSLADMAMWNIVLKNAGRNERATAINPAPLYYWVREKHNWQKQDTGSYISDNCDELLEDAPVLSASFPYSDDYLRPYSKTILNDGISLNYQRSHQPFYSNFLEHFWNALKQGLPTVFASPWPDVWFNQANGQPWPQGKLPANFTFSPSTPGHAYWAWGYTPGWVLCDNTWTPRWTPDAGSFGHHMRAGSFAIPASVFTIPGFIWEARVLSPELVPQPPEPPKPDPQPDPPKPPEPEPEPLPSRIFLDGKFERTSVGNIVIKPANKTASKKTVDSLHKKSGRATFEVK